MTRYLLSLLIVVAPTWAVEAQQCHVVHRHGPTVVAAQHHQPVIVQHVKELAIAQYLPVVVAVPQFAATYAPGYAPAAFTPALPVAQPLPTLPQYGQQGFPGQGYGAVPGLGAQGVVPGSLESRMARIEAMLLKLAGGDAGAVTAASVPGAPAADPAEQMLVAKCASCHGADVAAVKGKGIALTDGGKLLKLSPELQKAVIRSTVGGTMPKGGTLTDPERGSVIELMTRVSK